MMSFRLNRPLAVLAVVALSLTAGGSSAYADLEIWAREDSGVWTKEAFGPSGSAISGTYVTAHYSILLNDAMSNSPGTPLLAELLSSSLKVTGLVGSGAHTLEISIGDTGFTAPVTPPPLVMSSHIGGSVTVGNLANTLTFQSYVDSGNGQNSPSVNPAVGTISTTGPQSPNITASASSYNSDANTTIPTLTGTYSISQDLKIVLAAGSDVGWQANTQLSPTPEPMTLISAVTGLGFFGGAGWLRRRRKAA